MKRTTKHMSEKPKKKLESPEPEEAELEEIELPEPEPAGKPARKSYTSRDSDGDSSLTWYLDRINRIPLLSREDEDRYARLARDGDESAKEVLIKSNLRFVVSIAKKYQTSGISLLDLINEGNMGLIRAAERFDPDKGFHFISYAVW